MSNSYFRCESGGRHVTIWPCITGERSFYDVVYGSIGDECDDNRTATRLTAREAAAYVLTELGVGVGVTLDGLTRTVATWRAEYESQGREPVR